MAKILLIEDDRELSETVAKWLSLERHSVEIANNGLDGLDLVLEGNYDIFIMDVNLPGVDGFEICRQYRNKGGHTPIIMLTGQGQISAKETGFNAGADDYVTKPFSTRELVLRVNALLRRPAGYRDSNLTVGKLMLDTGARKILKNGEPLTLLPVDYALLEFFLRHPGETFSAETLISRVWPTDKYPSVEAVRTAIKRIRKQIDDEGCEDSMIETVNKMGYRLLKP
ncbi:MAG: response regulator transcription factor [Cyanobacteria bacterium SZAS TMP-1]|nr:response regulator transcription factor [Cyanobacteria bacterium SZAS TMP-1]